MHTFDVVGVLPPGDGDGCVGKGISSDGVGKGKVGEVGTFGVGDLRKDPFDRTHLSVFGNGLGVDSFDRTHLSGFGDGPGVDLGSTDRAPRVLFKRHLLMDHVRDVPSHSSPVRVSDWSDRFWTRRSPRSRALGSGF